ncbi:MAG: DUF4173 domain-containing protein [Planctomycetaceae bacterium]|nr:DUF4173 domain-containing protein [Planctomycetaceae bacterium]
MEQQGVAHSMRASHGKFTWPVIAAMTGLVDFTLYRAEGYAGPALFFPAALALLLLGRTRILWNTALVLIAVLLVMLSISMAWSGGAGQIVAGVWLLVAGNLAAQNVVPYVLETVVALAATIPGGYEFLHGIQLGWRRVVLDPVDHGRPSRVMNWLLPLVSVVVFGSVFALANPDIIKGISELLSEVCGKIQTWVSRFSEFEIFVWCLTFWLTGGLLRPAVRHLTEANNVVKSEPQATFEHPMFRPFRNTLLTLIILFMVYLFFEFCTLWFREFPQGFHYSGYAHTGAAWLTVALALATVTLSLIFRGSLLDDSRIASLRGLAWGWSALNFLLAASVYNRLWIYVAFNGMTRMRVVGLLGISAVVVGFILVLFKIQQRQKFVWLLRRQIWTLAFAVYVYLVTPVDILVQRFNVRQILKGSPAPCVQISEHPIADDALPQLLPLLDCDNAVIREGIQAKLRDRLLEWQSASRTRSPHWTATQFGIDGAWKKIESAESMLNMNASEDETRAAMAAYREYAMQWW